MRRTPSEAPSTNLLAAHALGPQTARTPSKTVLPALHTRHDEQIPSIASIDCLSISVIALSRQTSGVEVPEENVDDALRILAETENIVLDFDEDDSGDY